MQNFYDTISDFTSVGILLVLVLMLVYFLIQWKRGKIQLQEHKYKVVWFIGLILFMTGMTSNTPPLWVIGIALITIGMLFMKKEKSILSEKCPPLNVQSQEKEDNKKKILAEIIKNGKIDNEEIRKLTGVSRGTAINYCDELEKAGEIKQVGESGQNVHYTLK